MGFKDLILQKTERGDQKSWVPPTKPTKKSMSTSCGVNGGSPSVFYGEQSFLVCLSWLLFGPGSLSKIKQQSKLQITPTLTTQQLQPIHPTTSTRPASSAGPPTIRKGSQPSILGVKPGGPLGGTFGSKPWGRSRMFSVENPFRYLVSPQRHSRT